METSRVREPRARRLIICLLPGIIAGPDRSFGPNDTHEYSLNQTPYLSSPWGEDTTAVSAGEGGVGPYGLYLDKVEKVGRA